MCNDRREKRLLVEADRERFEEYKRLKGLKNNDKTIALELGITQSRLSQLKVIWRRYEDFSDKKLLISPPGKDSGIGVDTNTG